MTLPAVALGPVALGAAARAASATLAWGQIPQAPAWELHCDDCTYTAGELATWPARFGPAIVPVAGLEPLQGGIVMNGHPTPLFPTSGAQCVVAGAIAAGTYAVWTWEFVTEHDEDIGVGDRTYLAYVHANTANATQHIVFPHEANLSGLGLGFTRWGHFRSVWVPAAQVTPRRQRMVRTIVQRADGSVDFYINGAIWQRQAAAVAGGSPFEFKEVYLGASDSTLQWFKGSIAATRLWLGLAMTDVQILAMTQPRMIEFGVTAQPFEPVPGVRPPALGGWWSSTGKVQQGGGEWNGGASLSQWNDQSGGSLGVNRFWQQATVGSQGRDGPRTDGRSSVDFDGTDDFYTSAGLGQFVTTTRYEWIGVVTADAVSTNAANPEDNDAIVCEANGRWGLHLSSAAGVISVLGYHLDAGGRKVATSVGQLVLGTPTLIHWWYDGTNISLRVGANAAVTVAAGAISGALGQARMARRNAGQEFDGQIYEHLICRATSAQQRADLRAYFAREFPSVAV